MKIFHTLATCFIVAFLFTACGKTPTNGKLDGNWQLMSIATNHSITGEKYTNITSKKSEQIYWAFQLDLMTISSRKYDVNGYTQTTTARFRYGNNKLDITETYVHYHNRDSLLTDPSTTILEGAGITGNCETFNVKELSHKTMILSNDYKKLTFRKF